MRVAVPLRPTDDLPLGRAISPLFVLPAVALPLFTAPAAEALLLLIVRPVLESNTLPDLSTILVLEPDALLLFAEAFAEVLDALV